MGSVATTSTVESKRVLLKTLERLISLRAHDNPKPFESLREKLLEEQFQVVVMGEFKRGKSSLINALLGESILPVAAIPLTSVVTVVKAGPTTKASVEFLDGRSTEISRAQIEDYVAEDRNPKNHKQVSRVVVQAPSDLLGEGTLLVDTPGSGSVYRHNTEVAQKYLPQADAVILVISSDPPISDTEVQFLHSIRRWARKLFIVLNKIDYLAPSDLKRSLEFTRKVVHEALDARALLFPISAKLALEAERDGDDEKLQRSGFKTFIAALEGFLREEKSQLLFDSVQSRIKNLVEGQLLEIDMGLAGARATGEQWKSKVEDLKNKLGTAKRGQYELSKLYQAELKDHIRTTEESLYGMVRERTRKIAKTLEDHYRSIQSESSAQVREKLNKLFVDEVENAFSGYLTEEEPRWTKTFQEMTDRYLESTVLLVNDIRKAAAAGFGVEHRPLAKPPIAVTPPTVWFIVDEVSVWTGGMQSMPTLRIFKPFFWRAMKNKIGEAMDMNAGRLRYDYARRLQQSGEQILDLIQAFFDASIEILEKAVAGTEKKGQAAAEIGRADQESFESKKKALLVALSELG